MARVAASIDRTKSYCFDEHIRSSISCAMRLDLSMEVLNCDSKSSTASAAPLADDSFFFNS